MFAKRRSRTVEYRNDGEASNLLRNNNRKPNRNALAAALHIGQSSPRNNTSTTTKVARSPRYSNTGSNINEMKNSNGGSREASARSFQKPYIPARRSVSNSSSTFKPESNSEKGRGHNNNASQIGDLKLSHSASAGSLQGQRPTNWEQPRIVKRYIPSPNGIKVVEVPESNLKKDIQRSNSIRKGLSISRTGSMTSVTPRVPNVSSLNNVSGTRGGLRTLSMVNTPGPNPASTSSNEKHNSLSELQRQIDEEKRLNKDLEKKKLEYERLKASRIEKEEQMRVLEESGHEKGVGFEAVPEEDEEEVPITNPPAAVDEVEKKRNLISQGGSESSIRNDDYAPKEPIPDDVVEKDKSVSTPSNGSPLAKLAGRTPENGNGEETSVANSSVYEADDIDNSEIFDSQHYNSSIDASNILVDELDKRNSVDESQNVGKYKENLQDPYENNEIGVDFGNDKLDLEGSLAKKLRPKFDNAPEVINDSHPYEEDSVKLKVPTSESSSKISEVQPSSNESINDSKSPKRPARSSLKNSNSSYTLTSTSSETNPAQQAYLSLTTAENTRLNSKVSSSPLRESSPSGLIEKLPDVRDNADTMGHESHNKRPILLSAGLSARTFRAQAPQPSNTETRPPKEQAFSPLTAKTLRTSMSERVPHASTIQASGSLKERAAELYRKANSRPRSFLTKPEQRELNRLTLRDMLRLQEGHVNGEVPFKSRIEDSDDEDKNGTVSKPSDLEKSPFESSTRAGPLLNIPEGNKEGSSMEPNNKEVTEKNDREPVQQNGNKKEKKKFLKLRKLFAKNN